MPRLSKESAIIRQIQRDYWEGISLGIDRAARTENHASGDQPLAQGKPARSRAKGDTLSRTKGGAHDY